MPYHVINQDAPQQPTALDIWEDFIQGNKVLEHHLRSEIAASWQRCQAMSVDPHDGKGQDILSRHSLSALLEEKQKLLEIARPIMKTLYKSVQGNSFVVVLTDQRGRILHMIGDEHVLSTAEALGFVPGANWSEGAVGTNAIGTAIALDKPVQVAGSEHFCRLHHPWFCSAAPVHDYTGTLIGCLNLSCSIERDYKNDQGMVVAAVRAIENQLHRGETQDKLVETHKHLMTVMNSISEGILSVDQEGIITHSNPSFGQMFGLHAGDLKGVPAGDILGNTNLLSEVLATGKRCLEEELRISGPKKRIHCTYNATPILSRSGKVQGAVLVFREIRQVHQMIHKMAGSQARFRFTDIIGDSQEIKRVVNRVKTVAQSPSTLLILGESGTGKEMIAQAVHNASHRCDGPFVALNCAAMPRELIQSELFGYTEGAFTGASRGGRPGKVELAEGGTLFLDEIGDMPLDMQVNLLRVLQENTVFRLGGSQAIPVDVRVVAATNKNLEEQVEKGEFRRDLFYRLNVVTITMPPLRNRSSDIRQLVTYFSDKLAMKLGCGIEVIDEEVFQVLEQYSWPGNVRELENVVEYAMNMLQGHRLTKEALPPYLHEKHREKQGKFRPEQFPMTLEALEAKAIKEALEWNRGRVAPAAAQLGIARNTFYEKMKKYGIRKA